MKGNVEKSIKRWLKNKVKVTLGLMVSFLITGNIGYAEVNTDDGRIVVIGEIAVTDSTSGSRKSMITNYSEDFGEYSNINEISGETLNFKYTREKGEAYGIFTNKNKSSGIKGNLQNGIKIEVESIDSVSTGIKTEKNIENVIDLSSRDGDIDLRVYSINSKNGRSVGLSNASQINLNADNGKISIYTLGNSSSVGIYNEPIGKNQKVSLMSGYDIAIQAASLNESAWGINNSDGKVDIKSTNGSVSISANGSSEAYGINNVIANGTDLIPGANAPLSIQGTGINIEAISGGTAYGINATGAANKEGTNGNLLDNTSLIANNGNITITSSGGTSAYGISSDKGVLKLEANEGVIDINSIIANNSNKVQYGVGISLVNGLPLEDGKSGNILEMKAKEISVNTDINTGTAYGILSYNSDGSDNTREINISSTEGDIDIKAKAESGTVIGARLLSGSKVNIESNKNVSIKSENRGYSSGLSYGLSLEDKNIIDIKANQNINIEANANTGVTYGILSYNSGVSDNTREINISSVEGDIDIKAKTESGTSIGTYLFSGSKVNIESNKNINIEATGEKLSYGLYSEGENTINIESGKNDQQGIKIKSIANDGQAIAMYLKEGNSIVSGNTLNITSIGKEIDGSNAGDIDTNVTVSKIFNTTQGIRLQDEATLDLTNVNNLNVTSSDIAITANDADFNFNGNSYFEGNSYLFQNYTNDNLLVRPVLQAINDGNITLSGDTTVISRTGEDGSEDETKINNVGIYAQGDTNTAIVENVTVNGKLTVISGNDVLTEKYNIKTLDELKNLTPGDFKELISNTDIALMATSGGKINIDSNENVFLIGDILSGKANSEVSVKGGNGNPDSMVVIGEVLAANGGKVNLDMSNGGYFVGRADDYFTINNEFREAGFRNNKFDENIAEGGEVNIKLGNNAIWNTVGQSYVTNLDFTEGGGVVDLTYEGNALRIKNLSGEGTFNLTLDSENKESGNMLYVYNVVDAPQARNMISTFALTADEGVTNEDKVLTQTVNLTDSVLNLQPGEKLRFATLGDQATGKVEFVANEVKERGINNVSYNTENSTYDVNDSENVVYNGDETTTTKPGNEIVNSADGFNATENWYLTRGIERINDAGTTIIEMSKANYASAVYLDNLNKRLGDMTFAEGKEGFWVRLRNDRVGEDGEYRLHNYMTQLGYDKPYPMEEGKGTEYRGIAFEISKGDMEYKNINGDANVDRQALWLYDTNMYNNGFYSDYVFRAGRMESEFDIYGRETGVKVEGTYKNLFVGASAEYGYRYDLSEKTYLEPQVQLQYTYIDGTDYTTNQETKVELDEIHSVIGRAGARLGHDFYNKEGNKTATLYAKADINHEFLGDQRVKAKDKTGVIDKKYENDATWYDIGIGASKDVTPDFNVYMDVERQIGRTRDDQSWQFNLGFRYRFNDVKDLNPVVMLRDFTMKADNYFDFDKSELKPEGKKVVKEISNELTKENATGTLKIEGHTDSIGTNEYNQKLSERRAQSVENEFKQNITTDKIKYETRGYGEERPIADNATKEGRAKNRRVEINFGGTIEN